MPMRSSVAVAHPSSETTSWLACAVVAFCGAYLGTLAFVGTRGLIRAWARQVRRPGAEYAQLVTVHPDGVTTKIINLDHYRRRRERPHDAEPGPEHQA